MTTTPWRRDLPDVTAGLAKWVAHRFGPDATVTNCSLPTNGMANETVLFDLDGEPLVTRLAPLDGTPYPTFPVFDLELQRNCMELVRRRTSVPVPEIIHYEADPAWLQTPFLVMRRVDGLVPTDSPPYVAGGWLPALAPEDRRRVEEHSVAVLAGVHTVADRRDLSFFGDMLDAPSALSEQLSRQRRYYEWGREGRTVPAVEEALTRLEETVPAPAPSVLNWGDSRIGNIIYQGVTPAAVLDWEMATVGPREIDVAWMVFMHMFFQDMVGSFGMAGLPDFLREDNVVRLYRELSGVELGDLGWYKAFAGLRFAVILMRMGLRAIAFGAKEPTDDGDELILFAPLLRRLTGAV